MFLSQTVEQLRRQEIQEGIYWVYSLFSFGLVYVSRWTPPQNRNRKCQNFDTMLAGLRLVLLDLEIWVSTNVISNEKSLHQRTCIG